jgi:formylglycine-generating enzyme required for sulfatase activity
MYHRVDLPAARTLAVAAALLTAAGAAQAITIEMVTVDNAGNAPDATDGGSVGSVPYVYRIGKYEVTVGQYTVFLNAVAAEDAFGLYNSAMGDPNSQHRTYIVRSGGPGSYTYSVADDWADRPVNWVSFWDAARFANWLHNGQQGPGTTEFGAYHDVGDPARFGRNSEARYFIPNEDEWYKAAYHDRSAGLAANYFRYPTGSNVPPGTDPTEATNPGNNANLSFAIGGPYFRTPVGEFELSQSPYGTFDQGGNAWEWIDTAGTDRVIRGGSYLTDASNVIASYRGIGLPTDEYRSVGFRVAAAVPEPSRVALMAVAAAFVAMCSLPRRERQAACSVKALGPGPTA